MFLMKIAFVGMEKQDKQLFFEMLRTNLELGYALGADYQSTIGVNICVKHLYDTTQQIAKLIIWDISAEKFFKWVRPLFFNGSIGAIVLHSDNSSEGIKKTTAIIKEFQESEFPKHLLILSSNNSGDDEQDANAAQLEQIAAKAGFHVQFFENQPEYFKEPEINNGFWNKLRTFYENAIIEIFSQAVRTIPGNSYNITDFKEHYFATLNEYDKSIKQIYNLLTQMNLEHDFRNIFVRIKEGLFTINLFTSAVYYHYPESNDTKYICMVPEDKNFLGYSNIIHIPKNFFLSMAKALYLIDGNWDSVTRKQITELKKKKRN